MAAAETMDEMKKASLCDHRNLCRKWMQNAPIKVRRHRQKTQPWIYCRACKKYAGRLPDMIANEMTDSLRGLENYFIGFPLVDKSSMTEPKSSFASVTSSLSLPMDTAESASLLMDTVESAFSMSDMRTARDIASLYTKDNDDSLDDAPEPWDDSWPAPQYAFPPSDDVFGPLIDTMHDDSDSDNDPSTVIMGPLHLDGMSQADGITGAFHRFPVIDYDESVPEFVLDDYGCGAINPGMEEIRNDENDAKNPKLSTARRVSCDLM